MTNLSEHFTVEEFEYSDTAKAKNIDNRMDDTHKKAVVHLCIYVLEPLRKLFGGKYGKVFIKITSGYRGNALNKAVGGSPTSQHCANNGCAAADIWVYKVSAYGKKSQIPPTEVYNDIKTWVKTGKLTVDQCIMERVSSKNSASTEWTHISCASQLSSNRKQFLKYNGNKYTLDK